MSTTLAITVITGIGVGGVLASKAIDKGYTKIKLNVKEKALELEKDNKNNETKDF